MQRWLPLLLLLVIAPIHAQQDPIPVHKAIETWLAIQTKGLPGQVTSEIRGLDPTNQLAPCTSFEVSRAPGSHPWGRTHVVVRCLGDAGWRVNVPVHIRVNAQYLISARPIPQGQMVVAEDLATQLGDLSDLPANILIDSSMAIGKVPAASIPAGRPLRADMLRAPIAVRQGQTVRVVSSGPGFSVANEGRALSNAQDGQVVQVRLTSGQVISGIARAGGSVEVSY